MKNVIIGTAGHVDHGKTCLIKALTGMDCDRLKEEKKRGITIENGFADMLYGDYNVSFIDVPGHEKFVRNMLIGIGGIDLVLLVIALDEGVMPQTREHFGILNMLEIKKGIMVFTKCDAVEDEEWKELVMEDARSMVEGTFMEGCEEIEVSAFTGQNIDYLKERIIANVDDNYLKRSDKELFRLPVDRVFTIDGFGTVITGTLMEGSVKAGEEIMIYPQQITAKIRNLQVHNENVDEAFAGQRTAINMQGIKKEALDRGVVLARKNSIETTRMLDVTLELFSDADKAVLNGSKVHFYCGATESIAKVVLLDREVLEKGEKCYCQLRLTDEIAVRREDRFIIRFLSPMITIGGGKILEVTPRKHKKSEQGLQEALTIKDKGSEKEILEQVIREKSRDFMDMKALSIKQRIPLEECRGLLEELKSEGKVRILKKECFIHEDFIQLVADKTSKIMEDYHQQNSMSQGILKEELKSRISVEMRIDDKKAVDDLMNIMLADKVVKDTGNCISLYDFKVKLSPEMQKVQKKILELYISKKFEMPTVEEAISTEKDKTNAKHIIEGLEEEGVLRKINFQYYIYGEDYDWAIDQLRKHVEANGKITLAEFRDILKTSRKYAMAFMEHLDEERITKKVEDYRVLVR